MKTLFFFSIALLACVAEAREQYLVNRYEEEMAETGNWKPEKRAVLITQSLRSQPSGFSFLPSITPGWPLRGGKWVIKWEGTF